MHNQFLCSLITGFLLFSQQVVAVPELYRTVEQEHGIPPGILYAVALTESGTTISTGQYVPWPWTLNVAGEARFFRTKKEAWLNLTELQEFGLRNIDIGPAQVSWRWNGHRFKSSWSALDPETNIRTAAVILVECKQRTGEWVSAVGCYHSPGNQQRAHAYTQRVNLRWANLDF